MLKQNRMGSFSIQGNSVLQDGKCSQQALEIHSKAVSRWAEPQSGSRVVEDQ